MRPAYNLKGIVEVTMNIAGAEWGGEAECIYHLIPAAPDRDDEPGGPEYIELISCKLLGTTKTDITDLCDDKIVGAIQSQLLGEE